MPKLAKIELQPELESLSNLCHTDYAIQSGRASEFLFSACMPCWREDTVVPSCSNSRSHWSRAIAPGMTAAARLAEGLITLYFIWGWEGLLSSNCRESKHPGR